MNKIKAHLAEHWHVYVRAVFYLGIAALFTMGIRACNRQGAERDARDGDYFTPWQVEEMEKNCHEVLNGRLDLMVYNEGINIGKVSSAKCVTPEHYTNG